MQPGVHGSTERSLSTEERLLLLLAQGELRERAEGEARALMQGPLDWERFAARAAIEEVGPLVHRNLRRSGLRGAPQDVLRLIEGQAKSAALQNTLLAEELGAVLRLLGNAGIPVIPLKGVALAASLYGDATLRVCSDIDILVPRAEVRRALGRLLGIGYRTLFDEAFFADLFLRTRIEHALTHAKAAFPHYVELHWGVLWGDPFDGSAADDLWGEARPGVVCGAPAHLLSPEWELLFLSAHAARHRWQGLKWLVDIHEICVRGAIDWERVRAKAERLGWTHLFSLTLGAVRVLFGTPLPDELAPTHLPPWLKLFPDQPAGRPRDFFFPLRLIRRPSQRLRFLARLFFVPGLEERQLLRLPPALSFLYYPLRLLRLGARWGFWLVRAPWRRQEA